MCFTVDEFKFRGCFESIRAQSGQNLVKLDENYSQIQKPIRILLCWFLDICNGYKLFYKVVRGFPLWCTISGGVFRERQGIKMIKIQSKLPEITSKTPNLSQMLHRWSFNLPIGYRLLYKVEIDCPQRITINLGCFESCMAQKQSRSS